MDRPAPHLTRIQPGESKRRYPAHFLSKLTDSDGELQETRHWLDTAKACEYLTTDIHLDMVARIESISRQLGSMIAKHESFCVKPTGR